MLKAILFDLFETLVTESRTRPPGVSSIAKELGCERERFREHWKGLRSAVTAGRVTFPRALGDIAASLGSHVDEETLRRLGNRRVRIKAEPFERIEQDILVLLHFARSRGLRLGVISNCFAEDVTAWPQCALAPLFDCTTFSFAAGAAKPDPEIYLEAARCLRADVSEIWFIGDGADGELAGAERVGLRAFRALWFLRRWPHFREEPCSVASVNTPEDLAALVAQAVERPRPE